MQIQHAHNTFQEYGTFYQSNTFANAFIMITSTEIYSMQRKKGSFFLTSVVNWQEKEI